MVTFFIGFIFGYLICIIISGLEWYKGRTSYDNEFKNFPENITKKMILKYYFYDCLARLLCMRPHDLLYKKRDWRRFENLENPIWLDTKVEKK